jgi:hypothetical protein
MDLSKAAAVRGRKGGAAKVPKGFARMDPARRKKVVKAAIRKRWAKQKEIDGNAVSNARGNGRASQSKGGHPC